MVTPAELKMIVDQTVTPMTQEDFAMRDRLNDSKLLSKYTNSRLIF